MRLYDTSGNDEINERPSANSETLSNIYYRWRDALFRDEAKPIKLIKRY